ncbi:MAG: SGNH/GDSL hydrolase family protein [Cytophagales bacterium]|nr:SGNH/GDSL hydrolase family protein [Cytophagales bacterium]
MLKRTLLLALSLFLISTVFGQDHKRFEEDVKKLSTALKEKNYEAPIVFAGSSSIRFWDTEKYFPNGNIINHGFGGSETSDLVCYVRELILKPKPSQIFIYEGDNDLNSGKTVDLVLADMKTLLRIIKRNMPETPVHIISPKPSITRWELRERYVSLNEQLKALCKEREQVTYIDVWTPMLDEEGNLKEDLFIEDGLHMNDAGYEIWTTVVRPHLN